MRNYRIGAPSNDLTPREQAMLDIFIARGQDHLVSAFKKRRKYSRAWRSVSISNQCGGDFALALRREAFLGKAGVPVEEGLHPDDAHEAFLMRKYGEDEGFKKFMARPEIKWNVARRSDRP
jgi:hypothetical protein